MPETASDKLFNLMFFGRNGRRPFQPKRPRRAGQALEEKLDEFATVVSIGCALIAIGIAGLVLVTVNFKLVGALFVVMILYGVVSLIFAAPKVVRYAKGLSGEREVAAILDEVKSGGGFVVHDIPADGFNIDHVVISLRGIYAIETKYISKRKDRDNKLRFDAGSLTLRGAPLRSDPLAQAEASASELKRVLKTLGINKFVRPVVLAPGWFIEHGAKSPRGHWVLEPKAFPQWLGREPVCNSTEEIAAIAGWLERYSRTFD